VKGGLGIWRRGMLGWEVVNYRSGASVTGMRIGVGHGFRKDKIGLQ
jgi:hypothetical protein